MPVSAEPARSTRLNSGCGTMPSAIVAAAQTTATSVTSQWLPGSAGGRPPPGVAGTGGAPAVGAAGDRPPRRPVADPARPQAAAAGRGAAGAPAGRAVRAGDGRVGRAPGERGTVVARLRLDERAALGL